MLSRRSSNGCGVVVMNKSDYVEKTESILQDQSGYRLIHHSSTLRGEDGLICLLLKMSKEGFITNDEYNLARPVGSLRTRSSLRITS